MTALIDDRTQNLLFREARTANGFQARPVPDSLLREIYDLARMGPTSMNTQPMRVVFVNSEAGKARLIACVSPGNVEKVRQAPVTAIVAMDTRFYEEMDSIWHNPGAGKGFADNPGLARSTAERNSSLQGAYLLIAARAFGLDCGPMSGFDHDKLNAEFFPDGRLRANLLITLGYGDPAKVFGRNRRFEFDEVCSFA